ncbi:hypothetical protein Dimus_027625 [Dionaea muscipula]
MRKLECTDKTVEAMDKDLSALPEPVIHHIISFLHPKDAARLCVLSQRWGYLWNLFPILDFDERYFRNLGENWAKKMQSTIYKSLRRRKEQRLSIEKFRVFVGDERFFQGYLGDWIASAIELNVKVLEIMIKPSRTADIFELPSPVLTSNSIVFLSLFGCKLGTCYDIHLPQLQNLSLKRLNLQEEMLQKLISSCPSIQDLRLVRCGGLKNIAISTVTVLKRLDIYKCPDLKSIRVNAPMLRSFFYHGKKQVVCNIKLPACRLLTELVLEYPRLTDKMFEKVIVEFPGLEKLILKKCSALKKIHIPCQKLKELRIWKCSNLVEVVIDAESLVSLGYRGPHMPISLLRPMSLEEVELYLEASNKDKLYDFIQKLDHDKGLKMIILQDSMLVLHEDLEGKPFPLSPFSRVHLQISRRVRELIDNFLRVPLVHLYVISCADSGFLEIVRQTIEALKEDPRFCRCLNNQCWRHHLKRIITFTPENEVEWILLEGDVFGNESTPQYERALLMLSWDSGWEEDSVFGQC